MRAWSLAGLAVTLGLLGVPATAEERSWSDLDTEIKLGSFYHDYDDGQPDWLGQRLLARTRPLDEVATQLELTTVRRGDSDWGGQAALAVWADWTRHLYTVTHVAGSHSASNFFPQWRADLELHGKVPTIEPWVLFAGGGRAQFSDADTWITTLGTTYYFPALGGGSLSYRFTHFFNDFDTNSARGSKGDGSAHLVQGTVGPEHGAWGQLDLRYLYGSDLLRDFVAISGDDAEFKSHNVYAGWRRRWTQRFGTHVQLEWGTQEDLYDHRLGAEIRFVWYLGPQLAWRRHEWAKRNRATHPSMAAR